MLFMFDIFSCYFSYYSFYLFFISFYDLTFSLINVLITKIIHCCSTVFVQPAAAFALGKNMDFFPDNQTAAAKTQRRNNNLE